MGAGGPLNAFSESVEWMRFDSHADVEEYVRRLRDVPNTLQDYRTAMDEGISKGYTASLVMMRDVEAQLAGIIAGPLSDLAAPLNAISTEILSLDDPLRVAAAEAIDCIRASFQALMAYLKETYIPACRVDPSCSALPRGATVYEACLRYLRSYAQLIHFEWCNGGHIGSNFAAMSGFIPLRLSALKRFITSESARYEFLCAAHIDLFLTRETYLRLQRSRCAIRMKCLLLLATEVAPRNSPASSRWLDRIQSTMCRPQSSWWTFTRLYAVRSTPSCQSTLPISRRHLSR